MSEGAVYIAFGERYLDEAEDAAASLRVQMPKLEICLIGDIAPRGDPFSRYIPCAGLSAEEFAVRWGEPNPPPVELALYNKLRALELAPYERSLYLDSDTYCAAPVHELFDALTNADTAIALAPSRAGVRERRGTYLPHLNAGVIALRGAGRLAPLFARWHELYLAGPRPNPNIQYGDQAWLIPSLLETGTSTCVLPIEFNYRVSAVSHLVGPVRILHDRLKHWTMAQAAAFINAVHVTRLHLPNTGMFWQDGPLYYFAEAHKPFEPIPLSRQALIDALRQAPRALPEA